MNLSTLKYSFFFFLIGSVFVLAQQQTTIKPRKKVRNLNAQTISRSEDKYEGNHLFAGEVIFEHEGTKLYCDSAVLYTDRNELIAWSNARMINDTIYLEAHRLEYNGNTTIAKAFDNVHLKDKASSVDADYMEYNRTLDFATATGNVVIVDPSQRIESEHVTYDRKVSLFTSHGFTKVFSDDGLIESDGLVYHTDTRTSSFGSAANIDTKDYHIYSINMTNNQTTGIIEFKDTSRITSKENPTQYIDTENATFNKNTGEAWLRDRSRVYSDGKLITGDDMYFNEKTGFGWAKGDVLLDDPDEKRFIRGEYAEAYKNLDSAFVTKNAYAVKAFEKDSLYLRADTLFAVKTKDSITYMRAYHNARFYKSNLQGKADSLIYNQTTGKIGFYKNPIIWATDQQIVGDTIFAFNNPVTEKMDSVLVLRNAFAISKVDSLTTKEYNQVKGNRILGLFLNDELDWIEVEGNAISLSYMDDENSETKEIERIGINISYCGIIEADIFERNVEVMACRIQANSKLYPESKLPEEQRYLPDFRWRESEKFLRWQDILLDGNINTKEIETDDSGG